MKKFLALILFVSFSLIACNKGTDTKTETTAKSGKYTDITDQFAYVYALNMGAKFRMDSIKINPEVFLAGLKEGLATDSSTVFTKAEADSIFNTFNQMLITKQQDAAKSMVSNSQKWLDENKTKPGVQSTPSGLQYIIKKEGDGRNPKDEDFIKFKISGSLANGKLLDKGIAESPEQVIPVSALKSITGLYEGIKLMKMGGHYSLILPPGLGYGEKGMPERGIPGGSIVVFEIQLVSFEKKPAPQQGMPPQGGPQGGPQGQPQGGPQGGNQ
jgi:FKBP-type peptidyl-prolyl cis-trans isomerase